MERDFIIQVSFKGRELLILLLDMRKGQRKIIAANLRDMAHVFTLDYGF